MVIVHTFQVVIGGSDRGTQRGRPWIQIFFDNFGRDFSRQRWRASSAAAKLIHN
jgi:hypothetical protein